MKVLVTLVLAFCAATLTAPVQTGTAYGGLKRIQPSLQAKPICCRTRSGFTWLLPQKCRQVRGTAVKEQFCNRRPGRVICCQTGPDYAPRFSKLAADKCSRARGSEVKWSFCAMRARQQEAEKNSVCCRYPNPGALKWNYVWKERKLCVPPGAAVPNNFCPGH